MIQMKKMKTFWMMPLVMMTAAGCDLMPTEPVTPRPTAQVLTLELAVDTEGLEAAYTDYFVYNAAGVCPLEYYERVEGAGGCSAVYEAAGGDKTVVCIVNCPYPPNTEALSRYDAIEALTLALADEDPALPVLTGTAALQTDAAGKAAAKVNVTPLLCRIEVSRIINDIGGYSLVEDPVLYLSDINTEAELLRTDGFRQKETGLCSEKVVLAHDIGASGIAPHAVFYVYPNDSRESGAGTPATAIVLEGSIRGEKRSFRVDIPPFGRGTSLSAALTLEAETAEAEFSAALFAPTRLLPLHKDTRHPAP